MADLVDKFGIPQQALDGLPLLFHVGHERFFIKMPFSAALAASDPDSLIQATDDFMRFVAAFRAGDWEQVVIIEQECLS
jgi:hypothetical protein